jgi:hypothetical protein
MILTSSAAPRAELCEQRLDACDLSNLSRSRRSTWLPWILLVAHEARLIG